jgi:hypothetical protein
MQIVENHAVIAGTLRDVCPCPDRPGFVKLRVDVDAAHPVEGWPNLLERNVGETVDVLARHDSDHAKLQPGPVRLRVKKGGPTTIFAE